jgi:branched-chain amino acid transport system ATP-binding protein
MTLVVDVRDLTVRYGAAVALDRVSLSLGAGERVALIGPNGAGKTTLVNTLAGILTPVTGAVRVTGRLALVPEGRQMFGDLTVDDNLRLGAWRRHHRGTDQIYQVLPELVRVRRVRAGLLSGGQQQMVALGRALMSRPDILVLDEMSLGLAPLVVADLAAHLTELNTRDGLTILLIEQNARLALRLCERAYVLEAGRVAAEGRSAELAESPALAAAYLGGAPGGAQAEPVFGGAEHPQRLPGEEMP